MDIEHLIINSINSKIPISFSKYGDGEYYCAITTNYNYNNCDKDNYTKKLSDAIKNSFKYIVENSDNYYIGKWHENDDVSKYWESLVNKDVKWANYHTLIDHFNEGEEKTKTKVEIFKTIKNSNLKKIIICNKLLIKSKILLNIDFMFNVPFNNWFDDYFDNLINDIKNTINPNEQYIIMTCCGMSAKVVIAELHKLFPNNIYIDIGSAIDEICTKKNSRSLIYNYDNFMKYYSVIIPSEWNDEKYDYIYEEAKKYLGLHL